MTETQKRRGRPPGAKNKPKADTEVQTKVARAKPDFVYRPDDDLEDNVTHIDRAIVPDGMDYQWITDSIFGQFANRRTRFERKGWSPVPAERHDGMFMPVGYKGEINIDGLVLMERPMEYSQMAQQHDKRKAREAVAIKEAQLTGGDIGVTLDSHSPRAVRQNRIRKSYEPMQIPED